MAWINDYLTFVSVSTAQPVKYFSNSAPNAGRSNWPTPVGALCIQRNALHFAHGYLPAIIHSSTMPNNSSFIPGRRAIGAKLPLRNQSQTSMLQPARSVTRSPRGS